MNEHYYTSDPQSEHKLQRFETEFFNKRFIFITDSGVFSKAGIDLGTKILVNSLNLKLGDTVLDMGCGYGPIGIVAAYLVGEQGFVDMVDINQRAVDLTKKNINLNHIGNAKVWQSDGFASVSGQYDWILTNPPIRAGKKVVYQLVAGAFNCLNKGGGFMLVIRTKQGARSMERQMSEVFGIVKTKIKKSGYRVLMCIK